MAKMTQVFGYFSLSLGLSKPQVIEKYGSYANWIKQTNQYKVVSKYYRDFVHDMGDVSDDYDWNAPIYDIEDTEDTNERLLVDIYFGHSDKRTKLNSLIEYAKQEKNKNNIILCVYDYTFLGSSPSMIKENYKALLKAGIGIYFPDFTSTTGYRKELSTVDSSLNPLPIDFDPQPYIDFMDSIDIKPRETNWSGHNFKKEDTTAFYDAYFLYQLFLIGDEEAYMLSRLSKKSFPQKSFNLEGKVIFLLYPFIASSAMIEEDWFKRYPNLGDYYNLPRRCGKISKDHMLLLNAMTLSEDDLKHITRDELEKIDNTDLFSSEEAIDSFTFDYNKMLAICERLNLPQMLEKTFKRYCLRLLAAKRKEYITYYQLRDEKLCAAIHELTNDPLLEYATEEAKQKRFNQFFSEYYEKEMAQG